MFAVLYAAYAVIFLIQTPLRSEGGLEGLQIAVTAGVWALKAVAYTLVGRGILGIFINLDRPLAFFTVIRAVTDPFIHLAAPVTPGFLIAKAVPLYAAFLAFALAYLLPVAVLLALSAIL